jgi:3-oxoadipate enol-lactonase
LSNRFLESNKGDHMTVARVGDIGIYYEVHGQGEAMVMINGRGANSGRWFRQVAVFSQHYRVITFDNRGTGRSDKPDAPYTMDLMAADLAGLLEVIGIDVAHIFGVSMGGMIAQHFALNYPQKVTSLILGATKCGGVHEIKASAEVDSVIHDMARRQRLTPEERQKEMLPMTLSQRFIDENPAVIEQLVAKMLEYVTPTYALARQDGAIDGHDTYDRLPQIKAPTLVIAGEADRMIPVENSRLLASRIPNAELAILKGAGHAFYIEAEEETNQRILDFLSRHLKRRKQT